MRVVSASHIDFASLWEQLLETSGRSPALYAPANLAFYREYANVSEAMEVSFVVADKDEPICGLKAFQCFSVNGKSELSCFGLPILYFQSQLPPLATLHRAQRLVKAEIEVLLNSLSRASTLRYREPLSSGSMAPIGRFLLDKGGVSRCGFNQIVNLEAPTEHLHQGLTKAYKWAVNWGKKNLSLQILDLTTMTAIHMENFRLLHLEVAGRATRSNQSWRLQHEMVLAGEAFCVFAYLEDVLVCAALFPHSKTNCFYGVSASRRDLVEKPLSHSVVWTGMLHAKCLGIREFEMGELSFPMTPNATASSKELGISFFKRAFGGNTHTFLDISLSLSDNGTELPC